MRRILSNALLAVWAAVWVAFWVAAFVLYAIFGGFGESGHFRRRRKPKEHARAPLSDIRLCNYFTPDKYCDSTATGICVALKGQPCKWLDKVVRPLAPYGYIVRKDKP